MTEPAAHDFRWPDPIVHPLMRLHHTVSLSPFSIIGAPDGGGDPGRIERQCSIGSFCHIALSAVLEETVEVDHYVRIGPRTTIGRRTKILYNARIFADVTIGADCIVSGDLPNSVLLGDSVTFMGEIAHSHRNPHIPWDDYTEPSPRIYERSFVGVRALLVGPVEIGPRSYVAAGEVVRHNIPPDTVYFKGQISPLKQWKGLITIREKEP